MSEKKRKRREENGERPKKKIAVAPEGSVQVELLENKDILGPLLGMRKAIHATTTVANHHSYYTGPQLPVAYFLQPLQTEQDPSRR